MENGLKTKYPDPSSFKRISFDIETFDPNLKKLGPGVYRNDGRVLCCGISDGTFSESYPVELHEGQRNEKNIQYLRDVLGTTTPKVGFNLSYDIDWLQGYGINCRGRLYDALIAEALLDEERKSYSMKAIVSDYGLEKYPVSVQKWCDQAGILLDDFRANLTKCPEDILREYVISDIETPLELIRQQLPEVKSQELDRVFRLENQLVYVGQLMRKTGVRINESLREQNKRELDSTIVDTYEYICDEFDLDTTLLIHAVRNGLPVPEKFNYNSSKHIGLVLDDAGFDIPLTDKTGVFSITKDWLLANAEEDELIDKILYLRIASKLSNTFLENALHQHLTPDGLIHCLFHSTRNEYNGTRSGRYSSSKPNLQQVPALSTNLPAGRLCRSCFIPIDEDHDWGMLDYSQLEYRILAHYAIGEASDEIRRRYAEDPDTDYHAYVVELTGLKRRFAKVFSFSSLYGAGAVSLAIFMNVTVAEARRLLKLYHLNVPFAKITMDKMGDFAEKYGYVCTALGRRSRFNRRKNPKYYRALCRVIQGSAAETIKLGTLNAYEAGIFDVLPPHMTVHDELDVSVPRTPAGREAFRELCHIMEQPIPFKVPMKVEGEIMAHWGDQEEYRSMPVTMDTTSFTKGKGRS